MTAGARHALISIGATLALILLWWIASAGSQSLYFPPLSRILEATAENWLGPRLRTDLLPSLARLSAGFLIAVAVGVTGGIALGLSRTLHHMAHPMIEFLRAIPPPLFIPFGMAVLGAGSSMKIFVIALGAMFPILLNTIDGTRGIEQQTRDMARSFRLSRMQQFRYVVLPSIAPQAFAGIRIGIAVAVILMVVSEMVASTNGLGYFVVQSQRSFAIPEMWSGILVLGLLGFLLSLAVALVESRVLRWHRGARKHAQAN